MGFLEGFLQKGSPCIRKGDAFFGQKAEQLRVRPFLGQLLLRQRPFLALDIFDNLQKIEGVDLEG